MFVRVRLSVLKDALQFVDEWTSANEIPALRAPLHQASVSTLRQLTLVILFSMKTMELCENGLQPHSGATPLFSMRTVSLVSL